MKDSGSTVLFLIAILSLFGCKDSGPSQLDIEAQEAFDAAAKSAADKVGQKPGFGANPVGSGPIYNKDGSISADIQLSAEGRLNAAADNCQSSDCYPLANEFGVVAPLTTDKDFRASQLQGFLRKEGDGSFRVGPVQYVFRAPCGSSGYIKFRGGVDFEVIARASAAIGKCNDRSRNERLDLVEAQTGYRPKGR